MSAGEIPDLGRPAGRAAGAGNNVVYNAAEQALQDKAFAQLVDEKLAADESFRIFMSLSNDILDQAGKR